jgi:transposase-like protein
MTPLDTSALPGETGMMQERRNYSDELKVSDKNANSRGTNPVEVGKKLGIPKGTIGNWLSKFKDEDEETCQELRQ